MIVGTNGRGAAATIFGGIRCFASMGVDGWSSSSILLIDAAAPTTIPVPFYYRSI